MKFEYKTKGTCSQMIFFEIEDNKVHNVSFMGGCNGNLQGIGKLVEGMDIDDIISRFSLENDYPGDEDNGGMSSYYIFLMCGFFPYATTENYYLHGTRVSEILFHLGNGKTFRVTGENVGGANIYVQSATWQGKSLNVCRLTHRQILEGGELHFVMGDKPSCWAQRETD